MKQIIYIIFAGMFMIGGIGLWQFTSSSQAMEENSMEKMDDMGMTKTAVFAGGCFWCTESDFEKLDGVKDAISGYTGGHVKNPTYKEVSAGGTGHVEAVKVIYDPSVVSYEELLDYFWRHVNPTDNGGQFVDRGNQYRSAIFYADKNELKKIEASKKKLEASGVFMKPIVTDILPLGPFYTAEKYHQDFYKKSPMRYNSYRSNSGRDQFISKAWKNHPPMKKAKMDHDMKKPMKTKGMMGDDEMDKTMESQGMMKKPTSMYMKPDDATLKKTLSPLEYKVVRKNGTEPPFNNAYWNNHEPGIYVDIVSGEPLFSSKDKFDSGTGWPSFTRPLVPDNIVEVKDTSHFMTRIEVRSKYGDSHLGHVFNDGPKPTGLRYCINSASLRFIPEKDLEKEGYSLTIK